MPGIPAARVVAVIAETESGDLVAFGTGYLLDATRILTAWHCVIDRETGQPAASLRVVWSNDGSAVPAVVGASAPDLDVALLVVVAVTQPWGVDLPGGPVTFGIVDRDHSGELTHCEAIGFPQWQQSDGDGHRDVAEIHGSIRTTEGRESQRLVLRDPILGGVSSKARSTWGGFSGAAVFHGDLLLGVVIEHHPGQGETALRIRPIQAIASAQDAATRQLAEALGLRMDDAFRPVTPETGGWRPENADDAELAEWGWSLERDPQGILHWRPRARGVSVGSEQGWRFRGRTAALTAIRDWLDREVPDRRVLVVTGSPGAGKSAVLGRIVTTADTAVRASLPAEDKAVCASPDSVQCAVHAKGKTALDVAAEIAWAAAAAIPSQIEEFAPNLRDALSKSRRRFNVIIDALDETYRPAQASEIITKIILPMTETCSDVGAQVVVGSRRANDDGDLIRVFAGAARLIDLDTPEFFSEADLTAYALTTLQLAGDMGPGSPYSDEMVAGPIAARIAELSDRNFLIAGLTARNHGMHDDTAADPASLTFTPNVEDALRDYLSRIRLPARAAALGVTAEMLLTALAFAEAPGFPAGLWRTALRAIDDVDVPESVLTRFARSAAASFLIESSGGGDASFRLFHQALSDALLSARARLLDRTRDEQALADAFLQVGRDAGWGNAPAYLLRSLPAHAALASMTDALLTDDEYLLHADLRRLIEAADGTSRLAAAGRKRVRLLRLTPQALDASPGELRAAMFSVTEALENFGHAYRDGDWQAPYRAQWATTVPRLEEVTCGGHQGYVEALCAVTVGDEILLASGGHDDTVRLWDPTTGQQRRILEGHQREVYALCTVTVDGETLLASGSGDCTVRLWDPASGQQRMVLEGHRSSVTAVCEVTAGDETVLASGAYDGTVRLWDPATGQERAVLHGHEREVQALCAVTIGGETLLVSGSGGTYRTVLVWDLSAGGLRMELEGAWLGVRSMCAVRIGDEALLAASSGGMVDGTVWVWDLATGRRRISLEADRFAVYALCAVTVAGKPLLASGGADGTVRLWDLSAGQERAALEGHQDGILAICPVTVDGDRALLASGGRDNTVRVWNPQGIEQTGVAKSQKYKRDEVSALCPVTVAGETLLVSGGADKTVRLWNSSAGQQRMVLKGHEDSGLSGVIGLCAVTAGSETLLASCGYNAIVLWDPSTGQQRRAMEGHKGSGGHNGTTGVCAVTTASETLLASCGLDGTIVLWDPSTGQQRRVMENHRYGAEGYRYGVSSVCAVTTGTETLLVSGNGDGTVQVWNPSTGRQLLAFEAHPRVVSSMCAVTIDGDALFASVGYDGMVRVWDPRTGRQRVILKGHQGFTNGVCPVTVGDENLLASTSTDRTVRLWDPRTGSCLVTMPTHHLPRGAITAISDSLAIGLDSGFLVVRLDTAQLASQRTA